MVTGKCGVTNQDVLNRYQAVLAQNSDIQAHLPFLRDLAAKSKVVVELGIRTGNSTAALHAGVLDSGGHLWSVDNNPLYCNWPPHPQHTVICSDSLTAPLPEEIDLLFIDTLHTYGHTKAELALYGPRAKIICLHDTELERPSPPEPVPDDPPFPVRCAIEEYVASSGRRWYNREGSWGLGVIS